MSFLSETRSSGDSARKYENRKDDDIKHEYEEEDESNKLSLHHIVLIIIGVIIFVAIVAFYEVIKSLITEEVTKDILDRNKKYYTRDEIAQRKITNAGQVISNVYFAVIAIIVMLVTLAIGINIHY